MKVEIIRAGRDEDTFLAVFGLLLKLHREVGYAPLDPDKSAEYVYGGLEEGMTFLAKVDGRTVGMLGLREVAPYYSKETCLRDYGFYVRPKYRRAKIGVALLRAARTAGDASNKLVFVTVTSPDRRPKATQASLDAQIAGYVPIGHTIKLR